MIQIKLTKIQQRKINDFKRKAEIAFPNDYYLVAQPYGEHLEISAINRSSGDKVKKILGLSKEV
jgi:hypothetical protein